MYAMLIDPLGEKPYVKIGTPTQRWFTGEVRAYRVRGRINFVARPYSGKGELSIVT